MARVTPSRLLIAMFAASFSCALAPPTQAELLPYQDPSLPFEKRAADLVSRLTSDEKAGQLFAQSPAVPRLGIPPCSWYTEGLHGLTPGRGGRGGDFGESAPGIATVFPDGIAMAATWNPPLVRNIAGAIADEARARYDPAGSRGRGLILFCPTINLARDPRWGRTSETFGEDPFLASRLAVAYVKGLQGDDAKYLKTIATPKHFAAYNQETSRTSSNSNVSERTLREYYLAPFEAAFVEGHAQSTMSAFNAINNIPCTANAWLLTDVLRNDWGFQGAVVCDSRAVSNLVSSHRYVDSMDKAVAAAINAGLDVINDQPSDSSVVLSAVRAGLIKPEVLDRALARNFLVRFKLGCFDPPSAVPFARTPASVIGSPSHIDLALQAARESIVLLKNDSAPKGYGIGKLLPIDLRRVDSIAVIGPHAAISQFGSYSGGRGRGGDVGTTFPRAPMILDALGAAAGERVNIRTAFDNDTAEKIAASSDMVLFIGGMNMAMERASIDRFTLDLPGDQQTLLTRIVKINPRTVLVLDGGSPMNLAWAADHVPAILLRWYSGEQGATALADTLLGTSNPAGRLPLTFYRSVDDLPPMDAFEIASAGEGKPGRTYMYLGRPATYAFGHGLSYTTFSYTNLRVAAGATPDSELTASVEITNTGALAGDEVIQLYARKLESAFPRPLKQLIAFQRIHLARGETKTVQFAIPPRALSYWNTERHAFTVDPGTYEIQAAPSSQDPPAQRATIDLK